ncbi:MAG: hypothetical protein H0X03_03340 [Nitrosopumilus sp.]|nr:hypothetical protein [Nitrosopumilus sp.]
MTIGKTNIFDILKSNILSNKFETKKILLIVFMLPILFISVNNQNFSSANATTSFNDFVEQTQSNSQTNSNNSNCDNNVSIQTQTNTNGKTVTTSKNSCGDNTSVSTSSSGNPDLNGTIVSAEYDQKDRVIVNSIFGNWSLTAKDDNSKGFESSFIVQPISYMESNISTLKTTNIGVITPSNSQDSSSTSQLNQTTKQQDSNITSYILSNFIVNSVQQQNTDKTFVGKIDVVQDIKSSNLNSPDETNNYNGTDVSIHIIGDRVFINFGTQTPLFDEFKNIPLVGLITSSTAK